MALRQLLMVPILIHAWGVEYYGNWLVLSAIPSFMAMSNLGLGSSAAAKIATRPVAQRTDNAKTFISAIAGISVVFIVLVTIIACWATFKGQELAGIPYGFWILISLLVPNFVKMASQPLQGWWNSIGKAHTGMHLTQILVGVEILLYFTIPIAGGRALAVTVSSAVWALVWALGYYVILKRRKCPLLEVVPVDIVEIKNLMGKGVGYQLSPLWQALLFQGSIVLAKALFGAPGAAVWGSLRIINRIGNQTLELVSQSCGPEFQRNASHDRLAQNRILYSKSLLISLGIAIIIAGSLFAFGGEIFNIWTQGKMVAPKEVWHVLPLSLIPFSVWWISGEYQRALNFPWFLNIVGCIAAGVSLLVAWMWAKVCDASVVAMCVGAVAFDSLMALAIIRSTADKLQVTVSQMTRDVFSVLKRACRRIRPQVQLRQ
ncbi:hypothetical protein Hsar01_02913 [Haloferula sargassicola]|uniref:Polysaccharide biosynthesis protein n=2 Tax=Haloferula sargassicola TaxID=490096 RepID=A0ABP9UWH3_9BACT